MSASRRKAAAWALAACAALGARGASLEPDRRLSSVQRDIERLKGERDALQSRERGLLGEVLRLDAELRLKSAQMEEVSLRLSAARTTLGEHERELAAIEAAQRRSAPYVAARVREIYKQGRLGALRQFLGPVEAASSPDALRYATYLARRDAQRWSAWHEASRRLGSERAALVAEAATLASLQGEVGRSAAALGASRASRAALLSRIRNDREQHERALGELESAARELGRIVGTLGAGPGAEALDVRMFRGVLDWPAEGPVSSGFGNAVHPKFRTVVPHPGWDIDAPEGAPFRSVFDGKVAFAAALHGYGLTAIVDHGGGLLSVYAHAGVLLVSPGDEVLRGQDLGRVGDSGSLRGPYLYFELRDGGKPVDPAAWLRRR